MPLIRENATSLYRQIATQLREEISTGSFDPSGRLPSEAELGLRFSVSRVTVRLALDDLARDGLIERRKGKGTYVAGKQVRHELDTLRSFHESLRAQGLDAGMHILKLETRPAPADIATAFGWPTCVFLERLHLVDDEPIAVGRSFLPAALGSLSREDAEKRPTYAILSEFAEREVERAHVTLGAQTADTDLEQKLKTQKGAALIVMERVSYFADSTPAEKSVFYIRPERYRFTVNSYFNRLVK